MMTKWRVLIATVMLTFVAACGNDQTVLVFGLV